MEIGELPTTSKDDHHSSTFDQQLQEICFRFRKEYYTRTDKEKDSKSSVPILCELARLHRTQSPDKFSLIRSVGLFNAAILRNPDDEDIIDELKEVCSEILEKAGAENHDLDLVKKAKAVEKTVEDFRKIVKEKLDKIEPIPDDKKGKILKTLQRNKVLSIQRIQKCITKRYLKLMVNVFEYCKEVMGNPPCKFAVAGMGSLARNEITPYSDFEHMILLERDLNDNDFEYFRWYSVIFHCVILNLKETMIPSLNINGLNSSNSKQDNWFFDTESKNGISLDGMMPKACKFPLGPPFKSNEPSEKELIKPVCKMLSYLEVSQYQLKDVLQETCYVYGDKSIYRLFKDGVKKFNESHDKMHEEIKTQIGMDLDQFSSKFSLIVDTDNTRRFNVKKTFYRCTTIFITALGRKYKVCKSSCMKILSDLTRREIINLTVSQYLKYAVVLACEVRLKWYCKKDGQKDYIEDREELLKFVSDSIGNNSMVNYFQMAYCLQSEISRLFDYKQKDYFPLQPLLINAIICGAFGLDVTSQSFSKEGSYEDEDFQSDETEFTKRLKLLEKVFYTKEKNDTTSSQNVESIKITECTVSKLKNIGKKLHEEGLYEKALEFFESALQIKEKNSNTDETSLEELAGIYSDITFSSEKLYKYERAVTCGKKALLIYEETAETNQELHKEAIAQILTSIGVCLEKMEQFDEAIVQHQRALKHYDQIKERQSTDVVDCFSLGDARSSNSYGMCLHALHRHQSALENHKRALTIYQGDKNAKKSVQEVVLTLNNIGKCLGKLNEWDEALKQHKTALENCQKMPENSLVADTLCNVSLCYGKLGKHEKALTFCESGITAYFRIHRHLRSYDISTFPANSAYFYLCLGTCYQNLKNFDFGKISFKQAVEIIRHDKEHTRAQKEWLIEGVRKIGKCFFNEKEFGLAFKYYKKARDILSEITYSNESDELLAGICNDIGNCLQRSGKSNKAVQYHERALRTYSKVPPHKNKDIDTANCLLSIGNCFQNLQQYSKAEVNYKKALKLFETLTENVKEDETIALILSNIGTCLENLLSANKAIVVRKEAVEIYCNIDKKSSHECVNNSYDFSVYQQVFQQCKTTLVACQNKKLETLADQHTFSSLSNLGHCLIHFNRHNLAFICFELIQKISCNSSFKCKSLTSLFCPLILVECLYATKQHEKALTCCEEILEGYENTPPTNKINDSGEIFSDNNKKYFLGGLHEIAASTLNSLNCHEKSLEHSEKALKIYSQLTSHGKLNDPSMARTYLVAADTLKTMQQYNKAVEYYEKAFKKQSQSERLRAYSSLRSIAYCLIFLNNDKEAIPYLQELIKMKHTAAASARTRDLTLDDETIQTIKLCLKNLQK